MLKLIFIKVTGRKEKYLKYFYKNEYLNGIPILRGMNTNKRILFT